MRTQSGSLNNTDVFDSEKFIALIVHILQEKFSTSRSFHCSLYQMFYLFFRDLMRIYLFIGLQRSSKEYQKPNAYKMIPLTPPPPPPPYTENSMIRLTGKVKNVYSGPLPPEPIDQFLELSFVAI